MLQIESPVQVARRSDMDMNGHINNVTYLGLGTGNSPSRCLPELQLAGGILSYPAEPSDCIALLPPHFLPS